MQALIHKLYSEFGDKPFELDWVKDVLPDNESQTVIPMLMHMKRQQVHGFMVVNDKRIPNGLRLVEANREMPPDIQKWLDDFLGDRSQYNL